MKIVFYALLLTCFSATLAVITPKNIYDAVFIDKNFTDAQKKPLLMGMYSVAKADFALSDKKDFAKIAGFAFDKKTFDKEAKAAVEDFEAASKGGTATSAKLPPTVETKISEVSGAADKKKATAAALTEIGQQIGKGIVSASQLSADEVGAALVAGMKK